MSLSKAALAACVTGLLSAANAQEICGTDVNGDGAVDVNDLLGVLSNFGSDDADTDTNGDGTVDVNDLLSVLSNFGGDVAAANCGGRGGLAGGDDGSAVNCCGGGGSCGFLHCPALGAGEDGCVQPWNMPNGMNFETDCGESTEPAAPLWCPDSPPQMCRMMCFGGGDPEACANAGECNMRQGNCCDTQCVTFVEGGSAEVCEQGADCGGQIPNECGSSCPDTCGAPVGMCNMMCVNGFFCPSGQAFHVDAGECRQIVNQASMECFEPPQIALGRPFMSAGSGELTVDNVPLTASPVAVFSDWSQL